VRALSAGALCLLAAAGSGLLLAAAFGFQALGYAPCKMCLWQRWPHALALGLVIAVPFVPVRWIAAAGIAATVATAGIAGFHTGVERGWWPGPASCSGSGDALSGLSGADLLSTSIPETVVMCDQVAWAFLGLSMATWNMLASLVLAVIWAVAFARAGGARSQVQSPARGGSE
jgi:disulfide bond formation protein DsbB